jgi:hypothetical protein
MMPSRPFIGLNTLNLSFKFSLGALSDRMEKSKKSVMPLEICSVSKARHKEV